MSKSGRAGPNEHAADKAARAILERGLRGIGAQYTVHLATFGEEGCFNTNDELRDLKTMRRPDGRPYHRESIGRVRRLWARLGIWTHKRIAPGVKPNKLAKRRSPHGTALNVLNWAAVFGKRRPPLRGERRKVAVDNRRLARGCNAPPPRPRHAFVPFEPAPGLVEHMQRTGRDVDRAEKPGRDGREGVSQAELLEYIERAKAAMDSPDRGATGPPE